MVTVHTIEYISILITFFFFVVGSIYDVRTREVPDRVWLVYGPVGFILTLYQLSLEPSNLILTVASIVLAGLASFALNYFGLFGGADAKATMCLALTIPIFPESVRPIVGHVFPFFPLEVTVVSFVVALAVSVWFGLRNLRVFLHKGSRLFDGFEEEPRWKKFSAALTGYQTSIHKLQSTFYLYPMEEIVQDLNRARRVFHLFESAEADRDELISKFMESRQRVMLSDQVWVTPGLPMLLFFLIGVTITLLVGDPLFSFVVPR